MILGFSLATLIGFTLGILGGGGSILTVPILVYILKFAPKLSIALSLAIVGLTAIIGSIAHFRQKNIDLKVAITFAPLAMVGTFLGAKIAAHMSASTQLILFAVIMLLASMNMLLKKENKPSNISGKKRIILITILGFIVGVVTGIVGVGGGFLIVPALVILGRVPIKKSIGTSLFIISLNSLSGFSGYLGQFEIPWKFLILFTVFTSIGTFLGTYCIRFIDQKLLKKIFAIFLIIMGALILYKNSGSFMTSADLLNTFPNFFYS